MAGEGGKASHGGEGTAAAAATASAIPNAPSPSRHPSQPPPPNDQPSINPLHISDEQGANTYKHLLRESGRLHPEQAPSFETIVVGDACGSAAGSADGGGGSFRNGGSFNNSSFNSGDASVSASTSAELIPFSRLKFIRKVGSGAFAKVDICEYRPADGSPPSKVAVKRLTPGVSVLGMVDLAVEARLLRTLHHPYITGFIGVGKDDKGQGFLVEEFVDGKNFCFLFYDPRQGKEKKKRKTHDHNHNTNKNPPLLPHRRHPQPPRLAPGLQAPQDPLLARAGRVLGPADRRGARLPAASRAEGPARAEEDGDGGAERARGRGAVGGGRRRRWR